MPCGPDTLSLLHTFALTYAHADCVFSYGRRRAFTRAYLATFSSPPSIPTNTSHFLFYTPLARLSRPFRGQRGRTGTASYICTDETVVVICWFDIWVRRGTYLHTVLDIPGCRGVPGFLHGGGASRPT